MKRNLSLLILLLIATVAIAPTPVQARDPVKNFIGDSGTFGFVLSDSGGGWHSCADAELGRATGEGEFVVECDQRTDPLTPGNSEGRLRFAWVEQARQRHVSLAPVLVLWFQDIGKTVYIYPRSYMGRSGIMNSGDGWLGCVVTRGGGPNDRYVLGSRPGQYTVFRTGSPEANRFLASIKRRIAMAQAPILSKSASELNELASTRVDYKPPAIFEAFQTVLPILSIANSVLVGKHVASGKWPTSGLDKDIRVAAPFGYAANDLGGIIFKNGWVNAYGLRGDKSTTHYEVINIVDRIMDFKLARKEEVASGLTSHQWMMKKLMGSVPAMIVNDTPHPRAGNDRGGRTLYGGGFPTQISDSGDGSSRNFSIDRHAGESEIASATPDNGKYSTGSELMARLRARRGQRTGNGNNAEPERIARSEPTDDQPAPKPRKSPRRNRTVSPPSPVDESCVTPTSTPEPTFEVAPAPAPASATPYPDAPAGGREVDPAGE